MQTRTAILFFSRTASADASERSWACVSSARQRVGTMRAMIAHTKQVLDRLPYDVYRYCELDQEGATFGERISAAYQDLFDKGYQAVIAVGNDCPQVAQVDWQVIETHLQGGRPVIGATTRQGAYLIGLARDSFSADTFAALPWQTPRLHQHLLDYCGQQTFALPCFTEVHSLHCLADLIVSLRTTTATRLMHVLATLVIGIVPYHLVVHVHQQSPFLSTSRLRGPPASQ